jgi:hypothetical protein
MGKQSTKQKTIQGRNTLESLDSQLQEALRRIDRLERMVAENGLEAPNSPAEKRGKGRPSGIADKDLQQRAKSLVYWLEDNWPEISLGLSAAKNEQDVAGVLKTGRRLGSYVFQPLFYKEPERFAIDCWKFIKGKRYRQNPRNLAAAMAGLPEVAAKTSFDRCSKYSANCIPVGFRAYREYLRRKFHDRFRELSAAATPEEVAEILSGSRSKDSVIRYLRENPAKVLHWLKCGMPGSTHMYDEPLL